MHNTSEGKVLNLYITKDDTTKTKVSLQTAEIDSNGIVGDKFYAKDPERSILITSQDSYTLAKQNSINIDTGILGENILIDINPYSLVAGDRLQIGTALLEITQNCTLCKGLTTINSKLPKLLKNDRGIFAKVIKDKAVIHTGDSVKILKN
ncbi:MOSC domain-containing protein [Sulfurimonas sp.]|uniref:MOSC domain-containing protein n=1 Tax=Sulfurimonas sp. TaxID=2022749 RepID=UPI002637676B|nr:MOSC domain-containing protein [Sulfurimonas sp.]